MLAISGRPERVSAATAGAEQARRPPCSGSPLRGSRPAPKGYLATGDPTATSPTTASDTGSWFGPAGISLVAVSLTAAICLAKRKALPAVGVVAAIGPFASFALVALTLTYNPWLGRFFVFPIALSAALWGLALRSCNTAWAVSALSIVTLALSLVHYAEKPSGLRLLDRSAPSSSVWTMKRWQVQSQHDPAIGTGLSLPGR